MTTIDAVKTANDIATSQNSHVNSQANGHTAIANGHNAPVKPLSEAASALLQPRGMRKIRCPHCAVVNLEKFVTFPHCAGCGALLTKEATPRRAWTAWRRPLGPILWATVLCFAAAAAVGAALMLRRPATMGQMMVYGQAMRTVPVNGNLQLSLALDAIGGSAPEGSPLKNIEVRFDKSFLRSFQVVKISPMAQGESNRGSGHYFRFSQMAREAPIQFQFKARQPGRFKLKARVTADAQVATDYSATVTVKPNDKK